MLSQTSGYIQTCIRILVATACILSQCVLAQNPAPNSQAGHANTGERMGLVYMQGKASPLLADAYIPPGSGPFPAIIYVHGGAWREGSRTQLQKVIRPLAADGYMGFAIDYDLTPTTFPTAFVECQRAVVYLREHAEEFKVDPNRIAIAGSSAGGELAALVALLPHGVAGQSGLRSEDDAHVSAAIIFNGVLDLRPLSSSRDFVPPYVGGPCEQREEVCRAASPLQQVHSGAPPFYVGHGTKDEVVPFEQAQQFSSALEKAHVPVTFHIAEGGRHTYWSAKEYFDDNMNDLRQFLSKTLR
jgi:acetyl esterase/lipase